MSSWKSHTQNNPKEKHLWTQEAWVSPLELICMSNTSHASYSPEHLSCTSAPTRSTYWIHRQVSAQVGPMRQTSNGESPLIASSVVHMSTCAAFCAVSPSQPLWCLLNSFGHLKYSMPPLSPPCFAQSFNGSGIHRHNDCTIVAKRAPSHFECGSLDLDEIAKTFEWGDFLPFLGFCLDLY